MTKQEPTWAETKWTPEERQKLAAQLGQFDAQQLREILANVLNCDDQEYLAAELRGAIVGMAGRIENTRKRGRKGLKA